MDNQQLSQEQQFSQEEQLSQDAEMQNKSSGERAILIISFVVLAFMWGMSFYGTKVALVDLAPVEVLSVRWFMAFALFTVLILLGIIKVNYKGKPKKYLLLAVFLQPCTYAILEAWGIKLTTASESSIFIAAVPLAVVLLSRYITKEKLSLKTIIAVIIGFSGVAIVMLFSPTFSVGGKSIGYLALIGAVFAGALFTLTINRISKIFSTLEITYAMTAGGGIVFTVVSLLEGNGLHPVKVLFQGGSTTWALIYMGVGCSFLAYNLSNYALSKMSAAVVASINTSAINIVGVTSGIVLSGDTWGWYTILGISMTIASIILISIKSKPKQKEEALYEEDIG